MTVVLDTQLRELKTALDQHEPPPAVDRGIASAIARARRRADARARPRGVERWLAWPLALAASILAISFVVRQAPPEDVTPTPSKAASRAFLPLVALDELEQSADAYVVATRVPRLALTQMGLPVDPARADQPVDAELLVRPDGAVLAFRFVH